MKFPRFLPSRPVFAISAVQGDRRLPIWEM
eukprot:COSAG01_NODE_3476_length_6033_cov_3.090327_5_plen_29_part_01